MYRCKQIDSTFKVLCAVTIFSLAHTAAAELLLYAEDGYTLGPIYHAPTADKDEIQAAHELADYLGRVSGIPWSVEPEPDDPPARGIFVGHTRVATEFGVNTETLEPDGIHWRTAPDRLFLLGNDGTATRFAVAAFLREFCRVRWFMPGPLGEEVPRIARLRLPQIDFSYNPPFYQRLLGASDGDWRIRNFQRRLIPFNHNLHRIFPAERFDQHPQWFPYVQGERIPTDGGRGPNPNLAHPGAAEFAAEWVRDFFEQHPDALGVSLGTTDSLIYDESEQTLAWIEPYRYFRGRPVYSDLVFTFTNRVAEALWPTSTGLDARGLHQPRMGARFVSQLAYYWAEDVPSFELHPRVLPVLTSDRAQWFDPEYRENDKDLIRRWRDSGAEMLGTWDYYEGSPYIIPRVYLQLTADSIRFLHANGVRAFYAEGRPIWGFDVLRFWVASQLLWEPDASPKRLIGEFYRRFYGPAREPMRLFFEKCEQIWMQQPLPADWIKFYHDAGQAELFPPDKCAELDAILEVAAARARRAAENDPQAQRFVQRVALAQEAFAVTRTYSEFYYLGKEMGAKMEHSTREIRRLHELRDQLRAMKGQAHARFTVLENRTLADPSQRGRKPSAGARLLLDENFKDELLVGDSWGIDALLQPGIHHDNPGSWSIRMRHTEQMSLHRLRASADEPARLRIERASHFSLFQWLKVDSARRYLIKAAVRGQVSPGCRVALITEWRDTDGKLMEIHTEDRLPVGNHEWINLAQWLQAPKDAAWLYLGIKVNFQYLDDWTEIGPVSVWEEP